MFPQERNSEICQQPRLVPSTVTFAAKDSDAVLLPATFVCSNVQALLHFLTLPLPVTSCAQTVINRVIGSRDDGYGDRGHKFASFSRLIVTTVSRMAWAPGPRKRLISHARMNPCILLYNDAFNTRWVHQSDQVGRRSRSGVAHTAWLNHPLGPALGAPTF